MAKPSPYNLNNGVLERTEPLAKHQVKPTQSTKRPSPDNEKPKHKDSKKPTSNNPNNKQPNEPNLSNESVDNQPQQPTSHKKRRKKRSESLSSSTDKDALESSSSPLKPRKLPDMTDEEKAQHEEAMKKYRERRRQERERKRKKAILLQKKQEAEQAQEEAERKRREEETRKQEEERKKQIQERYEKKMKDIKTRKAERERILSESKSPSKNSKPLYLRMERQFRDKFIKAEQDKINDTLQKKREYFKKPTIEEYGSVDTDYIKRKKQKEEERKRQRELWKQELAKQKNDFYQGKAQALIKEEMEKAKLRDEEMKRKRQELKQKQRNYADSLKDKYKPKVDKKLRQQVEERAAKNLRLPAIKNGNRSPSPERSSLQKDGPRIDHYNRRYIQSLPKERRRKSLEPTEDERDKSPEKIRKLGNDYLAEVKNYVHKHMKSVSPKKERDNNLEQLKYKAYKLDSKAARKEKLLQQYAHNRKGFKKQMAASEAIADAVKMKLQLLSELDTDEDEQS